VRFKLANFLLVLRFDQGYLFLEDLAASAGTFFAIALDLLPQIEDAAV
jgi:hypothetical protein